VKEEEKKIYDEKIKERDRRNVKEKVDK